MLTVHHLNESRSQRILWLLEELEVPYQIACYEWDAKTRLAPQRPAYRAALERGGPYPLVLK